MNTHSALRSAGVAATIIAAGVITGAIVATAVDRGGPVAADEPAALLSATGDSLEQRMTGFDTEVDHQLNAIEERLAELAVALQDGRRGSQAAQDVPPPISAETRRELEQLIAARGSLDDLRDQRRATAAQRDTDRLLEAGFSSERIEWIRQRAEALAMEHARGLHEADHAGQQMSDANELDLYLRLVDGDSVLQAELGDNEYERFLLALNRPTSVAIDRVLSGGAAYHAGLRAGDEIVGYAGQRVFNLWGLNKVTTGTPPDQTILVDVLRDGQMMQVAIPSGPMGIESATLLRNVAQ